MSRPGQFIAIEGLEGAGKSSAIQSMENLLSEQQIPVFLTREPGGTAIGESLRQILKNSDFKNTLDARSELLLMYTSRIQLVEEVIKPKLKQGVWIISDRFELSSFAYQGGGRQLDMDFIKILSQFALHDFKPDLTFYLDIDPEIGLKRANSRGALDRIEQEKIDFFHRVATTYHQLIKEDKSAITIDASLPIREVQHQVESSLIKFLSQDKR
jgi:dTMP kinase